MNLTDQTKDLLLTRSLLLQRVSNSLTKDIINAYVSVIDDILAQIATGKNINLINMNKIIKELNAKLTPDLTSVNDDLVQLGISEASYVANGINGAIGIDLVSKLPTDRTVQKIVNTSLMDGLTISEWLGKQDKAFQETLTKQIRLAVIEGETNPQIVSRLKGALDIKNNNNIKTIVRTAVSTVTNQVRMETYKENSDVFKGYEHNSTLDARVSLICSTRDGATYDLEYKGLNEKGKAYPFKQVPLHFNCRSIILPITKTFRELGLDIDEVPSGTRSSMDGYVSRDTTFEQWFEGKSATFQESYLGKGRYQLFKDGKITFSDLVNQNGRTLSIAELSKINPVAKVSNIPTIDFGYDGKFNKYVADIRDEAKIVIDKLPKPNEFKILEKGFGEYGEQSVLKGKSSIGISKDIKNEYVFIHEYGHHIDSSIGATTKYYSDDITTPFAKAYQKDKELYKGIEVQGAKRFNSIKDIKRTKLDDILEKAYGREIQERYDSSNDKDWYKLTFKEKNKLSGMISDNLDAMTDGKMTNIGQDFVSMYSDVRGHGMQYYSNEGRQRSEVFANMFAIWSNKEQWSIMSDIMPNTVREFEIIMKGVQNGSFN